MEHNNRQRPPDLDLISLASPLTLPPSSPALPNPFVRPDEFNEKASPQQSSLPREYNPSLPRHPSRREHCFDQSTTNIDRQYLHVPPIARFLSQPHQHHHRSLSRSHHRPNRSRLLAPLKPWLPLIMYAITTLAFVFVFALYRTELFIYLDELSSWLRSDEQYGYATLFFLIFLTTIPPVPLYSTLIVLSGYTFGPWTGAIISYFAALSGALAVFIVSRSLLRDSIEGWLASCATIKRVVRAIEKRPKLLFLIRLAPYPYNVMNCLLAASPTLTLHTYTVCTALSLFKVIIHTSIGASIHSFRDYHNDSNSSEDDESSTDMMSRIWTVVGILLCVLILVYLSVVASRAVDDELDDGPVSAHNTEETLAFLSADSSDLESAHPSRDRPMSEIPSRGLPYRSSAEPDSSWS